MQGRSADLIIVRRNFDFAQVREQKHKFELVVKVRLTCILKRTASHA